MRYIRILFFLLQTCVVLSEVNAQNSLNGGGGMASGIGGTASYSLGETVFTTHNNINGSIVQGIQLSYESSIISFIEDTQGLPVQYHAYPNPTSDILYLKVPNYGSNPLFYKILDLNGHVLEQGDISSSETRIEMSGIPSSIYFIVILDDKDSKTFKVIKK